MGAIPIGSPYVITPKLSDTTHYRSVEAHPGVFMPVKKWDKAA
jgi:hypothetical protein